MKNKSISFLVIGCLLVVITAFYLINRVRNNQQQILSPYVQVVPVGNVLSESQQSSKIILIATGDVILGRSVNAQGVRKNDAKWAFKNISSLLKSGDLTLINLESPLIKNCPITDVGMIFCGRDENIEGLIDSGVDVVNVANNHAGNYGIDGLNETIDSLKIHNIVVSGLLKQPVYKEVNGVRFGFLGYNDIGEQAGVSAANEENIVEQVKEADTNSDVVVVSFHWGVEYTKEPTERQIYLAHLAIDNGADLIIGNHPHWVQSDEYYKGKYIKYAHGNTIFDQMWSEETKNGVIGKYTFKGRKLTGVEFISVYIRDYGQPEITGSI